jgi:hypothetical protein
MPAENQYRSHRTVNLGYKKMGNLGFLTDLIRERGGKTEQENRLVGGKSIPILNISGSHQVIHT